MAYMNIKGNCFCTECRKETFVNLRRIVVHETVRDKAYDFNITAAFCFECGNEVGVPGLIDLNNAEIDEQYRAIEDIITVPEIESLMSIYNIGKAPLSLALGFGEITVTRYLVGQIPSREYSNIMRHALTSRTYMESMLDSNKDRILPAAYNKAKSAIRELDSVFGSVSEKLLAVISCIFMEMDEVTPLMLQKLLYYVNALCLTVDNQFMFREPCEAWRHGPVYRSVYSMFKSFGYNTIEDDRFYLVKNMASLLSEDEKNIVLMVVETFGMYSGKTLERITHKESPWVDARAGYGEYENSAIEIAEESISNYFRKVHEQYDISSTEGLRAYIADMI